MGANEQVGLVASRKSNMESVGAMQTRYYVYLCDKRGNRSKGSVVLI